MPTLKESKFKNYCVTLRCLKETEFIKTRSGEWLEAKNAMVGESEKFIEDIHQQIQDDLGYAQSHYRKRTVTSILAKLNSAIHVYIAKQNRWGSIKDFFVNQVPEHLFLLRKYMLYSLILVVLGIATGYLGYVLNAEFGNAVLGDEYISTTLDNIEKKDPLGIYKSAGPFEMFTYIAINNLRVSIYFFVLGSLFALGSGLIIYYNGLILGVFSALLIQNGQGYEYFLTVYQHGTLEILTMVVEGAAGLCIGMSIFSPGKLSRLDAMKRNAKTGSIVLLGTFPIILLAAFIESFLTRFTDINDILRFGVILLSLLFVIYYFIFYPWAKFRHKKRVEPVPFMGIRSQTPAFYLRKNFTSQALSKAAGLLHKKWKPILFLSVLNLGLFWVLRAKGSLSTWGQDYLDLYAEYNALQSFAAYVVEFFTQPFFVLSAALGGSFSVFLSVGVFLSLLFAFTNSGKLSKNRYLHFVYAILISLAITVLFMLAGSGSLWLPFLLFPVCVSLVYRWTISRGKVFSLAFFKQVVLVLISAIAIFALLTVVKITFSSLVLLSEQAGILGENPSIYREINVSFAVFLVPSYLFFVVNACKHMVPLLIEQKVGEKINLRIEQIKPVQSSYGLEVEQ